MCLASSVKPSTVALALIGLVSSYLLMLLPWVAAVGASAVVAVLLFATMIINLLILDVSLTCNLIPVAKFITLALVLAVAAAGGCSCKNLTLAATAAS